MGSRNELKGYYWIYNYTKLFIPQTDSRTKSVVQCSLNGNELERFKSISNASSTTGINKSCIAKVCRGERNTAGGYCWRYV
ncbi:hypothetical protein [Aurantibacter aestuarii]|uniref:Nuclease-associated modular DNA-binding 1 domain-containing protein n=1 Tax=Aurantibacter aestuarii TaxID=1266046 RepID=A0A2T1N8Y3_9FLAO|nr:hypothetical protein C7H52_08420 [Aurantibacter aestuarii]